jgi:hypothetical protein
VTVVELPGAPYDALNTRLEEVPEDLRSNLRPLLDIPRMSTFAMGAMINRGVRRLGPQQAFVNVGVWNGFSFLSGLRGNPDRLCIGVDDFSEFEGPRDAFLGRLEANKGPMHHFFDMDYEEYFATRHEAPIGLYFYDGHHAYEHQLRGLQIAEPFFAEECVVMVDDTNWPAPRQATLDFIAHSDRDYELLLDVQTSEVWHPTFWNGVMVFQATGTARQASGATAASREAPAAASTFTPQPPAEPNPVDFDSRTTLVSLIVFDDEGGRPLELTIEAALGQTWPAIEVLVVSPSSESVRSVLRRFGERVVAVAPRPGQSALRAGLDASNGPIVALLDTSAQLDASAVETGLALPGLSRFDREFHGDRTKWARRALAANRDIGEVIPPDAAFVIAARERVIAQSLDPGRAMPLFAWPVQRNALDAQGAIAKLEELRGRGATFAAFLWETFDWLADRPDLEQHLRATSRPVLHNDRVRVLEFDRGQDD